jgi:hypothetical protein
LFKSESEVKVILRVIQNMQRWPRRTSPEGQGRGIPPLGGTELGAILTLKNWGTSRLPPASIPGFSPQVSVPTRQELSIGNYLRILDQVDIVVAFLRKAQVVHGVSAAQGEIQGN